MLISGLAFVEVSQVQFVWPRYEDLAESVEEYVLDMLRDQLNRRQPMDNVSRNLLRLLTATCGYKEVRQMAVQRLEMWLQNPKVRRGAVEAQPWSGIQPGGLHTVRQLCFWSVMASGWSLSALPLQLTKPAQDLLMSVCMNCNTHSSEDMEVISNLIKIRLKPKVLLNHYMLCIRSVTGSVMGRESTVGDVPRDLTVSLSLHITILEHGVSCVHLNECICPRSLSVLL